MNRCEICGLETTVPPEPGWDVVIAVTDKADASSVFCPEHTEYRLGWLEQHGIGMQYRLEMKE